ncbi:MAG: cardiolipin synthase ClsB [Pseudomonadota bacterium]
MRSVPYLPQNKLTLLHSGAEFFPALEGAIDSAQFEVVLETYIFSTDAVGQRIKAALIRAAARGVKVRVIVDWIGTGREYSAALDVEFGRSQVHYRIFNPWFRRGVTRSHRKLCVVDGALAFVGGLNLNDDLHCDYDDFKVLPAPRWDFAVQIAGPLVDLIHREANAQWARLGKMNLVARIGLYRQLRELPALASNKAMLAAFVVRDNLRNRRTIQRAYLQALGRSRKSVLLANPYFAPGHKFRNALARAAARGVEVTLLIGVGEFRMQDAVAHSFYPKLLKSGVKVIEYRKTQLHGKVAVVDDDWATVGSSNFDGLSLFLNQEANVVVKDAVFSQSLRAHIERGIADGTPVLLDEFINMPWYRRAWYGAAFMIYRSLMRIVTMGGYA